MPTQPKPPGMRARRNHGQSQWSEVEGASPPPFPVRGASKDARAYWRTVMSELGGMYGEADRLVVVRAALLHARFVSGEGSAADLSQLLAIEDRLGISPASRRRLQWELQRGTGQSDPDVAAPRTDEQVRRRTSTGQVLEALA